MNTCHLEGLEGVKKELVKASWFKSVTACLNLLKKTRFTTTADDGGAMSVYIDDQGLFRGYRYYMFGTRSEIITDKKTKLAQWLKVELQKIKVS